MSDDLRDELRALLNRHSRENLSDTPDHILAQYLLDSLAAFEAATRARDLWYQPRVSTAGIVVPDDI
jgi:hypothetical protein